jgi:hypothetical protein
MRKRLVVICSVVLAAVILLGGCGRAAEPFPEGSGEFDIQGLTFRSIAYYYFPGIYESLYNPEDNLRLITKAKNAGGNYLLVRAFYNCDEQGNLIGDDEEAEASLREAIATAHAYGMKVFLTPFVESMEFWPVRKWELSVEAWTETVLKWARFAQENGVEMFAPGFEMGLIMDKEDAAAWFAAILPQIREVYGGRVAFAEIPWGEPWDYIDGAGAFAGYDCAGITIFPWKDYDGTSDIRSFEDITSFVEDRAARLDEVASKYGTEYRFVATLGLDFWQGEEPAPDILALAYDISLDVLLEHDIDGVFLHLWASEDDQLPGREEVEDMLRFRWTLGQ